MLGPLEMLFDTTGFPARWHCGVWSPLLGWTHILADLGIFGAYLAIPVVLTFFVLKRRDLPFPALFWLFAAFIVCCGTTHLLEALIFWTPLYRLQAAVKVATAVVSWATVLALIPVVPRVLTFRSPDALELEMAQRTRELEAQKAEAVRLAQIVAQSADPIVSVDVNGQITSWNDGAAQVYGLSREEALGRPLTALVPIDERRAHERRVAHLLSGGRAPSEEVARVGAGGARLTLSVRAEPLRDTLGDVVGWAEIGRDLTEKVRADERFRLAVEAAPNAMVMVDRHGTIALVNQQAERLFGYERADLVGQPLTILVPTSSRASHARLMDRYYDSPQTRPMGVGRELYGRRANGQEVPIEIGLNPIQTQDGVFTLASITDITERKAWAMELSRAEARLNDIMNSMPSAIVALDAAGRITHWNDRAEALIGVSATDAIGADAAAVLPDLREVLSQVTAAMSAQERWGEEKARITLSDRGRTIDVLAYPLVSGGIIGAGLRLDDATERARIEEIMVQSEKMMSVGGLAAGMAHEINNPLGAILQGCQNLKRRLMPGLDRNQVAAEEAGITLTGLARYLESRQVLGFIDGIHEAGTRAARIVHDMLAFSRGSGGTIGEGDPAALIDATLRLAETEYDPARGYDFRRVQVERSYDRALYAIPMDLSGMQQVLLNLFKNAAFAMAAAGTEAPRLSITTRREGEWAVIEIADNGPGMSEDVRRRAFEPFFTTKGVGQGTGLGLSVSYFIINRHGGTLTVDSAPGAGCKFTLRLPVTMRPASALIPTPRTTLDGT